MIGKNWQCPYCGVHQSVTQDRYYLGYNNIIVKENAEGLRTVAVESVVCANEHCKKSSLFFYIGERKYNQYGVDSIKKIDRMWRLSPDSIAKPQPDFIPEPLRNDYYEACRICDLSPKAAATLARRCLQGMIRDFFGISKQTLNAEINELRKQAQEKRASEPISDEVLDAIDHIRKIGNIGAHMEKDIDLIVDVDPEEAQVLIELIETLFEDWYVARENRRKRFLRLTEISKEKELKRLSGAPVKALPPPD